MKVNNLLFSLKGSETDTARILGFKQTNKIKKKQKKNNLPVDSDLYVVGGLSN